MSRSSREETDRLPPRSPRPAPTLGENRTLSRRAFGRSMAAATAASALGTALWPRTLQAFAPAGALGGTMAVDPLAPSAAAAPFGGVQAGAPLTPIRIGSNENPYGLGPAALAAVQASCPEANRYPFGTITQLASRLAELHGVPPDNILLAPGSGEILRGATAAFTSPSRALVAPEPTFETPAQVAKAIGAPVRGVRVLASGSLDLDGMAARAAGAGLFFVCNPNNPTGGMSPADAVTRFIARARKAAPDAIVLVDEAYFEFVADPAYATAMPLTRSDPKVIVARTFSKIHGMAGLRVGYAVGHPDTLGVMRRAMSSGTLSGLSASTALASLGDAAHLRQQVALNAETRAAARRAFEEAGFTVLPSATNFLMVDIRQPVGPFQARCREAGVQIARPFPPLDTHARISIGTAEEMTRAVAILLPLLRAAPESARKVARAAAAMPDASEASRLGIDPYSQRAAFAPFPPIEPIEWPYVC